MYTHDRNFCTCEICIIASSLHIILAAICQEITQGEYDKAKGMFEAAQSQAPGTEDDVLAEALGLMLVRIEAREFELERNCAVLPRAYAP